MRALWQSLHTSLMRSTETLSFQKQYEAIRRSDGVVRPFSDPCTLLGHLHADGGDPDGKNKLLAVLVVAAQGAGPVHDAAAILLWLALWPGLDALYRRLLRHFVTSPEELVSEISDRLTTSVHRLDLHRVNRIAATLLRNIERDIRHVLRARWSEAASRDETPEDGEGLHRIGHSESMFGLPSSIDADVAGSMIATLLENWIGDDAGLVLAVVIHGETQREAARRFGISHDAARKRFQRAMCRLQKKVTATCPSSAAEGAFSY